MSSVSSVFNACPPPLLHGGALKANKPVGVQACKPAKQDPLTGSATTGGGFLLKEALLKPLTAFTDALYNRGEGVRYAIEQTFGYTIPRVGQQWESTREFTGEGNQQAAEEMFLRDMGADIADTFLPGMLATLGVAKVADAGLTAVGADKGLMRFNMDWQSNAFYRHLLQGAPSATGFYERVQQALPNHNRLKSFHLQHVVERLASQTETGWNGFVKGAKDALAGHDPYVQAAQELAERLGHTHLNVTLTHPPHVEASLTEKLSQKTLETTLPTLLRDLTLLQRTSSQWGKALAKRLASSNHWQAVQGLGTVAALYVSLNIPHWIIEYEAHKHGGKNINPMAAAVEAAYRKKQGLEAEETTPTHESHEWFPFLKKTLTAGNPVPTAISAAFMGLVAAAVATEFRGVNAAGKPGWQLGKGLKNFLQFERGFPFTTVPQMTLTYGALCGIRLMESRDNKDFYSTLLRDNMLGYPTLTWGNAIFRKQLSKLTNEQVGNNLVKQGVLKAEELKKLGAQLLFKEAGATQRRDAAELTEGLVGNLLKKELQWGSKELSEKLPLITKQLQQANSVVTLTTAASMIALLALIEPQLGIRLSKKLTLNDLKNESAAFSTTTPPTEPKPAPLAAVPLNHLGGVSTSTYPPTATPLPSVLPSRWQAPVVPAFHAVQPFFYPTSYSAATPYQPLAS